MTASHSQQPIEGPGPQLAQLRAQLAAAPEWTSELVDAQKLCQIAGQLGFGHFSDDDICGLWRIGLLRADLVRSEQPLSMPGLIPVDVQTMAGYVDVRPMALRPDGYGSSMDQPNDKEPGMTLLFHPFRVYVLHHVVRTLIIHTSNCQYLRWTPGVLRAVDSQLRSLNHWTGSNSFPDRFDHWNQVAELAVSCAPVAWPRAGDDEPGSEDQAWLRGYIGLVQAVLRAWGLRAIHDYRRDLAMAAHEQDSNSNIHTLLRLMKRSERDRIEGRLGAAMKFLAMAESIRRAGERLLGIQLPEEDELGPGQWMDGARKMLYGHERVFDAPKRDLRDFLGILGLDFGVKVRCYVEGETELGALRQSVGTEGQCAFVNLKGNVVERGGKGMAFLDSLAADLGARVFSVVVLDSDRTDVVRLLKKAAAEQRFFGAYFLFDPDIEFANFTIPELLEVVLDMAQHTPVEEQDRAQIKAGLLPLVREARSGKEFFRQLHGAGVQGVDKGERWGEALMSFAARHQTFPADAPRAGAERPIVDAARLLIRAQDVGFLRSMAFEQLDAETGRVVTRKNAA
jgi:hypothetical protein